jgi:hypothetical protein
VVAGGRGPTKFGDRATTRAAGVRPAGTTIPALLGEGGWNAAATSMKHFSF